MVGWGSGDGRLCVGQWVGRGVRFAGPEGAGLPQGETEVADTWGCVACGLGVLGAGSADPLHTHTPAECALSVPVSCSEVAVGVRGARAVITLSF